MGIIAGGATSDKGFSDKITARENSFPYDLIKKSLSIQVEAAEASVEDDRIHILNSIVGKSGALINNKPPTTHDKYIELNDSLRGTFAASAASLQGATKEGGNELRRMIKALSRGR